MRPEHFTRPGLRGDGKPWPVWRGSVKNYTFTRLQQSPSRYCANLTRLAHHWPCTSREFRAINWWRLAVLRFYNRKTGRFDPSYEKLAGFDHGEYNVASSIATVGRYLRILEGLGVFVRQRRCEGEVIDRGFKLVQISNAYRLIPSAHWRIPIHEKVPHPTAWGAQAPMKCQTPLEAQAEARAAGASPKLVADRMLDALEYTTESSFAAGFRSLQATLQASKDGSKPAVETVSPMPQITVDRPGMDTSREARLAAARKWVAEHSRRKVVL